MAINVNDFKITPFMFPIGKVLDLKKILKLNDNNFADFYLQLMQEYEKKIDGGMKQGYQNVGNVDSQFQDQ